MATPIRVNVRDGRRDGRVGARVGVVSAVVYRPRVISTRVFCTAGLWCRHRTGAAVLVAGANTARSTDLYLYLQLKYTNRPFFEGSVGGGGLLAA